MKHLFRGVVISIMFVSCSMHAITDQPKRKKISRLHKPKPTKSFDNSSLFVGGCVVGTLILVISYIFDRNHKSRIDSMEQLINSAKQPQLQQQPQQPVRQQDETHTALNKLVQSIEGLQAMLEKLPSNQQPQQFGPKKQDEMPTRIELEQLLTAMKTEIMTGNNLQATRLVDIMGRFQSLETKLLTQLASNQQSQQPSPSSQQDATQLALNQQIQAFAELKQGLQRLSDKINSQPSDKQSEIYTKLDQLLAQLKQHDNGNNQEQVKHSEIIDRVQALETKIIQQLEQHQQPLSNQQEGATQQFDQIATLLRELKTEMESANNRQPEQQPVSDHDSIKVKFDALMNGFKALETKVGNNQSQQQSSSSEQVAIRSALDQLVQLVGNVEQQVKNIDQQQTKHVEIIDRVQILEAKLNETPTDPNQLEQRLGEFKGALESLAGKIDSQPRSSDQLIQLLRELKDEISNVDKTKHVEILDGVRTLATKLIELAKQPQQPVSSKQDETKLDRLVTLVEDFGQQISNGELQQQAKHTEIMGEIQAVVTTVLESAQSQQSPSQQGGDNARFDQLVQILGELKGEMSSGKQQETKLVEIHQMLRDSTNNNQQQLPSVKKDETSAKVDQLEQLLRDIRTEIGNGNEQEQAKFIILGNKVQALEEKLLNELANSKQQSPTNKSDEAQTDLNQLLQPLTELKQGLEKLAQKVDSQIPIVDQKEWAEQLEQLAQHLKELKSHNNDREAQQQTKYDEIKHALQSEVTQVLSETTPVSDKHDEVQTKLDRIVQCLETLKQHNDESNKQDNNVEIMNGVRVETGLQALPEQSNNKEEYIQLKNAIETLKEALSNVDTNLKKVNNDVYDQFGATAEDLDTILSGQKKLLSDQQQFQRALAITFEEFATNIGNQLHDLRGQALKESSDRFLTKVYSFTRKDRQKIDALRKQISQTTQESKSIDHTNDASQEQVPVVNDSTQESENSEPARKNGTSQMQNTGEEPINWNSDSYTVIEKQYLMEQRRKLIEEGQLQLTNADDSNQQTEQPLPTQETQHEQPQQLNGQTA